MLGALLLAARERRRPRQRQRGRRKDQQLSYHLADWRGLLRYIPISNYQRICSRLLAAKRVRLRLFDYAQLLNSPAV